MKILITGYKGQLGQECAQVFNEHQLLCTDFQELDITDRQAVESQVRDFRPEFIINCAAYTRVDDCETNQQQAFRLNVDGPDNLAHASELFGCKLIHISTDYVFNGSKPVNEFYTENDIEYPISFYGKTKFDGEQRIRQITKNHIIIRTAWLYGSHGDNFLKTMLKISNRPIRVVNDQFGSPTWAYRLALQIQKILYADVIGTFHATSEGHCSWFDLASYFLKCMNVPHNISPCSTAEYKTKAKRPMNSILENARLKSICLNIMPHWKDDIDIFVEKCGKQLLTV